MIEKSRSAASQMTRRTLMEASVRLFAQRGFAVTTLQDIVNEAGLTKGAFYHHFASKDEVLLEIHEDFITSLLERTEAVLAQNASPRRSIELLIREMLVSFELFPEAVSVFFREHRSLSPDAHEVVRAKRDVWEHILVDLVERGIEIGELRQVANVRLAAFGIVGMCTWAHEWFDPTKGMRATELGDMYADMLMSGLAIDG